MKVKHALWQSFSAELTHQFRAAVNAEAKLNLPVENVIPVLVSLHVSILCNHSFSDVFFITTGLFNSDVRGFRKTTNGKKWKIK